MFFFYYIDILSVLFQFVFLFQIHPTMVQIFFYLFFFYNFSFQLNQHLIYSLIFLIFSAIVISRILSSAEPMTKILLEILLFSFLSFFTPELEYAR